MNQRTLKRTPLHSVHVRLGGQMVEYGGWEMPLQYKGILAEHRDVRNAAGLFDISHLGRIKVAGSAAGNFLNQVLTNDLMKLQIGQGHYTFMCNEQGKIVDDLYAYRLAESEYFLVANATRTAADIAWLTEKLSHFFGGTGVALSDISRNYASLALQGPRAARFIDASFSGCLDRGVSVPRIKDLKKNQIGCFSFSGTPAWIARTGYTGEDGFEIFVSAEVVNELWDRLLLDGQAAGLVPVGLGARDTLRTEACFPLFGHELDEQTTPVEAGLDRFVDLAKPNNFIGRQALVNQALNGVTKKCIAFKLLERAAPPRPQYPIWSRHATADKIGKVSSGIQSPSLGIGAGMGYVRPDYAKPGAPISVEIRNQLVAAEVVAKPLYRRPIAK